MLFRRVLILIPLDALVNALCVSMLYQHMTPVYKRCCYGLENMCCALCTTNFGPHLCGFLCVVCCCVECESCRCCWNCSGQMHEEPQEVNPNLHAKHAILHFSGQLPPLATILGKGIEGGKNADNNSAIMAELQVDDHLAFNQPINPTNPVNTLNAQMPSVEPFVTHTHTQTQSEVTLPDKNAPLTTTPHHTNPRTSLSGVQFSFSVVCRFSILIQFSKKYCFKFISNAKFPKLR
ncbi:hypothetical protein RFI_23151, partial [Reticulomyxa filosa]